VEFQKRLAATTDFTYFRPMIRPEDLIGKLLLRHNCVIVPGFGGFVAQRVAAVVDHEKGIMLPPKKALLFNRQLMNNDGLLAAELVSQTNCSYESALNTLEDMVQKWNSELSRGARVSLDKVGFLFYDQEKNLCFEQDRFFNLLLESFGLGKVHFTAEKEEAKIIELKPVTSDDKGDVRISIPKRAAWKYLAAACVLPIAFYSFWIPAKTNVMESGMFSVKDFNPFFKNKPAVYAQKKLKYFRLNPVSDVSFDISENYEFQPGLIFPLSNEGTATEHPETDSQNESIEASNQFIVGCFSSQENVENMLQTLRSAGLDAYVYDTSNGLQRVSAGGFNQEADLQVIREKLSAIGIRGWIYRSN
jgi:hypothetical protein